MYTAFLKGGRLQDEIIFVPKQSTLLHEIFATLLFRDFEVRIFRRT